MDTNIWAVNCSQPQGTPAGNLLGHMFYGGFLGQVLKMSERRGYPHNGGEHSLTLMLTSPEEYEAFLALVQDRYGKAAGVEEFVQSVKDNFFKKYHRELILGASNGIN